MFYKLASNICKKANLLVGLCIIFSSFQTKSVHAIEQVSPYSQISVSTIVQQYIQNHEDKKKTNLCQIMSQHGSDKGNHHNYTTLYFQLFNQFKNELLNIFELGLGTNNIDVPSNMGLHGVPGASLYGWAQYFPNAKIYGADIDKRILFNKPRISTFYCDQSKKESIEEMFSHDALKGLSFDIIIEDGLHEFDANVCFLKNSISHLKPGGIYIIEDLKPTTASMFRAMIPEWKNQFRYIEVVKIPTDNPHLQYYDDNTLLIIQK
ncbi:MAG: class I SAM-dependent methyltransferase [Parachlamydiaceae bacterium]